MEKDYSQFLIKEYKYWLVNIHENQGYLGRCVVWCKRSDALDLTDATKEEQEELFEILKKLRKALRDLFQPNWFNYAFLGNETRHLHCHFIPRYAKPRVLMGILFEDKLYGHNYETDHSFITPEPVLSEIKSLLKKTLGQADS
jgi:diadenosine tetraphosphate (Ap4A) HIT family hydrolase